MTVMRAKMKLNTITKTEYGEKLEFSAVCASTYPEDGTDENNTYAKFTPSAKIEIDVRNPALFGKFEAGKAFYIDFTETP